MAVNITTDTNTVKVTSTTTNNVKIVDNKNNTTVSVSQPTTRIIKVTTVGPQGPGGTAFPYSGFAQIIGSLEITGSLSQGINTVASGSYSHAQGSGAQALGYSSHAEGFNTFASGSWSHAEGYATLALGENSHAEGFVTVASGKYQHVQGQYNISSSAQSAFIIGNGTSNASRSNLVFASGSQFQVTGSVNITGSLKQNGYEVKPYKVFTALLTQSGGDDGGSINFNDPVPLTIGVSYQITGNVPLANGGSDFRNIGAPNNEIGTWFIATGTTPIWGEDDGQLIFNAGAPVATVLENTIGNIWFTYVQNGEYSVNSNNLFILNKTAFIGSTFYNNDTDNIIICNTYLPISTSNQLAINCRNIVNEGINGQLNNTTIEIRVYN